VGARKVTRRAVLYGVPAAAAGAAVLASGPSASSLGAGSAAISPKDCGAVGDGVTDDTAAINQCLAQHRAVDFGGPENTYLVTGTLLAQRSDVQVLTGDGATIKAGAAVNMMRFKNAAHRIGGIVFDGSNQASGLGLIVEGTAQRSVIQACSFSRVAGSAISVAPGAHHTTISGCLLDRCGHGSAAAPPFHTSIFVADADHCSVVDNTVLGCNWGIYFRGGTAATGINLYTCRGNTIVCASPAPAASQGISNSNGRNGSIESNTIVGFADNSIDCWGCRDVSISGNHTRGGKDGVFVGDASSGSISIAGNVFAQPQRGVRVHTPIAGALVAGIVVAGNVVSNPSDGGVLVNEEGTAQVMGISVTGNELQIGDSGSYGVKMVNAEASKVAGNRIFRPRTEGILLSGVDLVDVSGNMVQDAGRAAANTYDAIRVTGSNRVIIRDNTAYGGARYAVSIDGGSGMTVTGTRWRSLGTGGVSNAATNTVLADNVQL